MTHLFTHWNPTFNKAAIPAFIVAVAVLIGLTSAAPVGAQIAGTEHQLEGAWSIDLLGDPGSITVKTSGFFTLDGSMFIQTWCRM